jgi:uncharacterized protein (DUF58 family)
MINSSSNQYSKYFNPHYLTRIGKFSLKVKEIVEGYISGLHKSSRHGINVEYKDHRTYNPGDDLKYLDWRLLAKTDRLYIKQFEEESNLNLNLILDVSQSMNFKYSGKMTKLEYSKFIVGAMLYLSVFQNDSAGLSLISNKVMSHYNPSKKMININNLLNELEKLKAKGDNEFKKTLIYLSEKIKNRSLVVVVSDFLHPVKNIIDGLKYLKSKKNDIILFVVNDRVEREFSFKRNIKFIDMETDEDLTLNPVSIKEQYLENMNKHYKTLDNFAHRSQIDIHYFSTEDKFEDILFNYLLKRSKIVS